jgi:hypothetical protein
MNLRTCCCFHKAHCDRKYQIEPKAWTPFKATIYACGLNSDAHEPNLPRAESVRAYLVKARAQARVLLIIIIIIQVYCPYGI